MSEQETIKGKFKVVATGDIEEAAKEILKEKDQNFLLSVYSTYIEVLTERDDSYFVANETLYQFVEKTDLDGYDAYCNLEYNEDGTISFITSFYNGGTCEEEMIEDALKKQKGGKK